MPSDLHHSRVAVSDADLRSPGDAPRRRDRDHRRDPRRRGVETRHPPGPEPGAAGPAGRARCAARRPVRHRASRRAGGGVPRWRPGRESGGARCQQTVGGHGVHSPTH